MNFCHKVDEQLTLAIVQPCLAEEIYALVDSNREHLAQWMPWIESTKGVEQISNWIKQSLMSFSEGTGITCAILLNNTVVGIIGYNKIDKSLKKVKIGYWVSSEHQGKGIITRACRHLIGHAFNELAVNKVEITVATENIKSRAVCERLGMELEGIISNSERVGDQIYDHAVYSLKK